LTSTITSKNNVSIRLTDERWGHITEEHGELTEMQQQVLEAVTAPDRVLAGGAGELLAVRSIGAGKWLVVVYRELETDGFVITAFMTRRNRAFEKRKQVWP
jgi:hypothetical protein